LLKKTQETEDKVSQIQKLQQDFLKQQQKIGMSFQQKYLLLEQDKKQLEEEINNIKSKNRVLIEDQESLKKKKQEFEQKEKELETLKRDLSVKQNELDQKMNWIHSAYSSLDEINRTNLNTLKEYADWTKNESTKRIHLADESIKRAKEAEQRLLEVQERIETTFKILQKDSFEFKVLGLTLEGLLTSRVDQLQILLSAYIPDQTMYKWKRDLKIQRSLEYLKTSKGTTGLRFFRECLIKLKEDVSIQAIDSSSCSSLFK